MKHIRVSDHFHSANSHLSTMPKSLSHHRYEYLNNHSNSWWKSFAESMPFLSYNIKDVIMKNFLQNYPRNLSWMLNVKRISNESINVTKSYKRFLGGGWSSFFPCQIKGISFSIRYNDQFVDSGNIPCGERLVLCEARARIAFHSFSDLQKVPQKSISNWWTFCHTSIGISGKFVILK